TPTQPFRFFDLPAEIRLRIYEHHLTFSHTIDLDPANHRLLSPRLSLFLTSHRTHAEASRVFYATNTFRLLPLHGRFFHSPRPLLARLPPRYRHALATLELRLGPGWTGLPKSWAVSPASEERGRHRLGLAELESMRTLCVFVECDPASDDTFAGFRRKGDDGYFSRSCADLLSCVLLLAPAVERVRFDAFPGIGRDSPLLRELVGVHKKKVRVEWGPERGW
ncbi:uncharacterized protein K452DRAFT_205671, partial [Aplosporella prunicola CBS 121167]